MIDKIKSWLSLSNKISEEAPEKELSNSILKKQFLRLLLLGSGVILAIMIAINIVHKNKAANKAKLEDEGIEEGQVKIEVASKSLSPEKMWHNHFEDKLMDTDNKLHAKLQIIEESFSRKEQEMEEKAKLEAESLKQQLEFARQELQEAVAELRLVREAQMMKNENEEDNITSVNLSSYKLENEHNIERPKSSRNYIPETAYVTGVLLGGINVSTSVGSSSEPVPVIIRITNRGNLPKNFDVDLKTCRILGSSYGDISSERAIIRAEILSCQDKVSELITTTKIAGLVYGDDGMNGIKGKVIRTSSKQVQNALIGGLISGFANTAKAAESFNITSLGAISTKKANLKEKLRDNSMVGVGNAGDKLADYYLRQAESMSPVLQIPGGTKVDIVFTKGVYLGSSNVRSEIAKAREMERYDD